MTEPDRVDMDPGETGKQLALLRAAGEDLKNAWLGIRDQISNPGAVGQGPLGAQFMSQYADAKKALFAAMDGDGKPGSAGVAEIYQEYADVGDKSVVIYEHGAEQAAHQFGE